jgi:hypothetical protein
VSPFTETPGAQWKISVTDPVPVTNDYYTDAGGFLQVCGLPEGDNYTVREDPQGLSVDSLIVNGVPLPPQPVYTFDWKPGMPEPVIIFKNGAGGGGDS